MLILSMFSFYAKCGHTKANNDDRYEQLKLRADVLREELHTETDKMIQEIIKFKLHVQNGLVGYEEVLAEEVDKEFSRGNDDTQDMDMD